ncbi:reverse transcriptase [Senna tora]|uniref:Reverse transcriptase n=1 Tax=Senna tora TaxID=362788 RepID=A0A834SHB0_9FABA|nr:reverse transcriptase [Senna tora]
MWTTRDECKTIVNEAWCSYTISRGTTTVTGKLEAVKSELTKWDREDFGNVNHRIRDLTLKAKYFKNSSFIDAQLGSNPSFTWRSILKGKEVLRKGLVRRIGDGSTTYIFNSPWIKMVENFTIPYNNQNLSVNATVNELILPESKSWNTQMIYQSFDTLVAEEILKIPLSRRRVEDGWMWVYSNNGSFTVKTAYKAAHQSYSDSNRWGVYKGVWKRVWNMNVPSKIRNFVFWQNKGLRFEDVGGNGISLIDWFQGQLQSLNNREIATYCILASKIWQRRNSVVHGSAPYCLSKIWDDTQRMVELIKEGDEASPITHNHTDSPTTGWQAPSSWFVFKLNVDASLRMNERGRIGCVIRDSNGRCIAAMTKKIQGVVDVVQLEALAVYEGLSLAKSLMCTELQVEDDFKQVMDLLKRGGLNRSYLGQIIEDILDFKSNFNSVSFNWVARSANLVAHTLAFSDFSFPVNSLDSYVWLEDFPSIICNALRSDIS